MPKLDHRMQVLVDERRYRWLRDEARRNKCSVGETVRQLIDDRAGGEADRRAEAGRALLAAEPMPVSDWPEMKREILTAMEERNPDV